MLSASAYHGTHGFALCPTKHGTHLDTRGPGAHVVLGRCSGEELEEQGIVVRRLGGLGVGGALVEEREGSSSDVETVEA